MNELNSGDLNTLKVGECMITKAYKTSTDKIQLEFAEKVTSKDRPMSALTALNASDSRFSSGAARGWAVAEIADASKILKTNFGDDGDWYLGEKANGRKVEMMDLNIINPTFNNTFFRVRVEETLEPTKSQTEYAEENGLDVVEHFCKRAGKGGDAILHKGQHIFRNSYVDLLPEGSDPAHVFLASDTSLQTTVKPNTGVTAEEVEVLGVGM